MPDESLPAETGADDSGHEAGAAAKAALRERLRAAPPVADPSIRGAVEARLEALLSSLGLRGTVGYVALRDEIDLGPLWIRRQAQGPVYFPRTADGGIPRVMAPRDAAAWERGPHGVRQPRDGRLLDGSGEGVVFCVPGLAFDASGQRLGRGAGWYDRLLAAHPEAVRVGIATESRIVPGVPHDVRDVPMDFIVTETRLIVAASRRAVVREETNT